MFIGVHLWFTMPLAVGPVKLRFSCGESAGSGRKERPDNRTDDGGIEGGEEQDRIEAALCVESFEQAQPVGKCFGDEVHGKDEHCFIDGLLGKQYLVRLVQQESEQTETNDVRPHDGARQVGGESDDETTNDRVTGLAGKRIENQQRDENAGADIPTADGEYIQQIARFKDGRD